LCFLTKQFFGDNAFWSENISIVVCFVDANISKTWSAGHLKAYKLVKWGNSQTMHN
jgi:hypothetical protein